MNVKRSKVHCFCLWQLNIWAVTWFELKCHHQCLAVKTFAILVLHLFFLTFVCSLTFWNCVLEPCAFFWFSPWQDAVSLNFSSDEDNKLSDIVAHFCRFLALRGLFVCLLAQHTAHTYTHLRQREHYLIFKVVSSLTFHSSTCQFSFFFSSTAKHILKQLGSDDAHKNTFAFMTNSLAYRVKWNWVQFLISKHFCKQRGWWWRWK